MSIANGESGLSVRTKLNALLASSGVEFAGRAALASGLSDDWPLGTVVSDGTVQYVKMPAGHEFYGTDPIPDMPGFAPFISGGFDAFIEHFIATSTTSAVNITSALQSAINYVGAIGTGSFGQGGKLGLMSREYVVSDNDADGYVATIANSMTIEGSGPNSSTLYINTTTDGIFYVGKGDAAILADTVGTAIVDKVIFRGIQFYNQAASAPTSGAAIVADRSVVETHGCRFINFFIAVIFAGSPESCRVSNFDITAGSNAKPRLSYDAQTSNFTVGETLTGGTSGATATIDADTDSGTTGTLTLSSVSGMFVDNETITDGSGGSATSNGRLTGQVGSCGIAIDRRQVNPALGGAYLDATDGNYYQEPNYVAISKGNIRQGGNASHYGGAYAIRIGACDTVDIEGCHLAWGYVASVGIVPSQANISLTDVRISGGLIDPFPGKSLYGVYVADGAGVGSTTIGSISVDNTSIAGASEHGVSVSVDARRFKMDNVDIKACGKSGIVVADSAVRSMTLANVDVFNTNTDGGTSAAIYASASDRLKIIGCNIDTGYRGIQLTTSPTRTTIIGNTFDGLDNESIYLPSGLTGEVTIYGNDIDESHIITAANRMRIPVGLDYVHFEGSTAMYEFRTDSPSSGYSGRRFIATFDDAPTVYDDAAAPGGSVVPNIRCGADIVAATGTAIEFVYAPEVEAGKWVVASTRANA